MKLDLLTNATVVDDAIRFVSSKSRENKISSPSSSVEITDQSNEPDYNGDRYQLEEKAEEIAPASSTTNKIF